MQDQKEQHFHDQILQQMPMAYACHKILWDPQGRPEDWEFVEVNSAFEKVIERSAKDLKGQRGSQIFQERPEAFALWLEEGGAVALEGGVRQGEHYFETLEKWYSYRFYAPQKEYFAVFLWDITEEKQKLRQRETLLMFLHHAVFTLDENYVFREVFPGCEADLFVSPEKCLGRSMYDLLPRELCVQFEEAFQEAREKRKSLLFYTSPFEDDPRSFEGDIHYVQDLRKNYFVISVRDVTLRTEQDRTLQESLERLDLALDAAHAGLWDWDLASGKVYFDARYYTMAGYEPNAFLQSFEEWQKLVHPEDLPRCLKTVQAVCASQRLQGFDMDFRFLRKDGEWMWIRGYGKVVARSPEGKAARMVGFHLDSSERKEMEELLFEEKERFRTTLLSIGDGIVATDAYGHVLLMNHVAERLTGYTVEEARGRPLREIFRVEHEETGEAVRDLADRVLTSGEVVHLGNHVVLLGRDGARTPLEDSAAPIRNVRGEITGVVVVCSDMTEKKKRQQEILYLSTHDHLTGLWNRRSMEETLQKLDTPEHLPLGIVVADVNGLKLINDAFGYAMGDTVLHTAGELLCRAVSEDGGVAGRLGGDEFGVFLPRKNHHDVEAFIERVMRHVASVDLGSVVFSLALGYAVKTRGDEKIEKVRIRAENALHRNTLRHAREVRSETVERVLMHLNTRYDREQMHTEGVATYAEALARALEYSEHQVEIVRAAAVLHDIGKIMVPLELLNKVEPLTEEEVATIRKHPETGYEILRSVEEYAGLAEYVLYHHERWDGRGYPQGLQGEAIPLVSRIITVADAYEAMTAQRPYQKQKTSQEAAEEIRRCAGTQFDPRLAHVFLERVL